MASYQPPPPDSAASSNNGTIVLVLGILGLVFCQFLAPVAWIMGNNTLKTMDQMGGGDPSARSQVNIGRICGIIGTVVLVLGILAAILVPTLMVGIARSLPGQGQPMPNPGNNPGPVAPAPTTPGPSAPVPDAPTTPGSGAPAPDAQTPPAQPGGM